MFHLFMSLFFIVSLFSGPSSFARDREFGLPAMDQFQEYQQKGDLFTIRLVPADKETRVYLVGDQVASFKIDQVAITGTFKFGKTEKVIKFRREKDYFTTADKLNGDVKLNLQMQDSLKKEEFRFKLQKN